MAAGNGDSKIAFDTDSGISEEEQREILERINGIAEKNRESLSSCTKTDDARVFTAKKHGGLFPILVNVFAVLVLASGLFTLVFFQAEADVLAREGARALTGAERMLIDEIRMETSAVLSAKDDEIRLLLVSLAAIERQMWELVAGGGELTVEQLLMQTRLQAELEERQEALALAREERALILNEARLREVTVLTQRASDPDHAGRETEPHTARDELARLSMEQARSLRMEDQITGLFATVHRQVDDDNLDAAARSVESLRIILDDPDFHGLRGGIPDRREFFAMMADTIGILFYRINGSAVSRLENSVAMLRSENTKLLSENETLTSQADILLENLAARTQEATVRQSQIATLNQTVGVRDNAIRELHERNASQEQTIETLNNQLNTVLELLRAYRQ